MWSWGEGQRIVWFSTPPATPAKCEKGVSIQMMWLQVAFIHLLLVAAGGWLSQLRKVVGLQRAFLPFFFRCDVMGEETRSISNLERMGFQLWEPYLLLSGTRQLESNSIDRSDYACKKACTNSFAIFVVFLAPKLIIVCWLLVVGAESEGYVYAGRMQT